MCQAVRIVPRNGGVTSSIFVTPKVPVSQEAMTQAKKAAALPGVVHALGMPDIHASGSGLPNGFVLATEGVVYPAAVGGDINCGMQLLRLRGVDRLDLDFETVLPALAAAMNIGQRWSHIQVTEEDVERLLDGGLAMLPSVSPASRAQHPVWDLVTAERIATARSRSAYGGSFAGRADAISRNHKKTGARQLGTIGDGNHFLEFQRVEQELQPSYAAALGLERGALTIMIHTGSRGMGHDIGTHYMNLARAAAHGAATSVPSVAPLVLESEAGREYFDAMYAAANYAAVNRFLVGALVTHVLQQYYPHATTEVVYDVPHNIAVREIHQGREVVVHRKGATRAFPPSRMSAPYDTIGEPVLIPGSMGAASYVLVGCETSAATLHSVNHGAGRQMSRKEALGHHEREEQRGRGRIERQYAAISDRDFERSMRGIAYHVHDRRAIKAEAPQAFKPIDEVIAAVEEFALAQPVVRLQPIGVVKE